MQRSEDNIQGWVLSFHCGLWGLNSGHWVCAGPSLRPVRLLTLHDAVRYFCHHLHLRKVRLWEIKSLSMLVNLG